MSLPVYHMSTHKLISYCQRGLVIGMGYGGVAYGVGYVYGLLSPHTPPSVSAAIFGISQAAYRTFSYAVQVWQRERALTRNPQWKRLNRNEMKQQIREKYGKRIQRFSTCLLAAHYVLISLVLRQFELINTKTEMGLIGIIASAHTLFFSKPSLIKQLKKFSLPLTALAYLITFVAMKRFALINSYREALLCSTIASGHLSLFIYPRIIYYL